MMKNEYDIVIVGNGLVGASLALALSQLPLEIAIIEAQVYTPQNTATADGRSVALNFVSCKIVSTLGLSHLFSNDVSLIKKIHISAAGQLGITRLIAEEFDINAFGVVVPIHQLVNCLFAEIKTKKNVHLICPAKVVAINQQTDDVAITVDASGEQYQLNTRLLVGCDGTHSTIRELAGFEQKVWNSKHSAIVANLQLQHDHHSTAYERFTTTGVLAMLPLPNQRASSVLTVSTEQAAELMALEPQAYLQVIQETFGFRLGRLQELAKRFSYPLRMQSVQDFIKPRTVLLGNAAHTMHPIAAQGFNLGLRDVAWLAEIISQAHADKQDFGSEQVLQQYLHSRQADQKLLMQFTDQLSQIFTYQFLPVRFLRSLSLMALDNLPYGKQLVAKWGMGRLGKQAKLALGLALSE